MSTKEWFNLISFLSLGAVLGTHPSSIYAADPSKLEAIDQESRHQAPRQTEADWRSGDRFWVTDWIAPYGHSIEVANALKKHPFFAEQIVRFLGHREIKSQFMYQLHGRKVSPAENTRYSRTHPVKPGFIKE